MNIVLITPPGPSTRTGNAVAALRWARILRRLGHRVTVAADYADEAADAMVAIHAWRSAEAVHRFKTQYPDRPVILQLSGTDIYQYITDDPAPTLRSMDLADKLVALNSLAWRVVPKRFHKKLIVVFQSVAKSGARRPSRRHIDVAVIGHLRDVKDPLRAAAAARLLPPASRIRIVHIGRPYNAEWAAKAKAEMGANPRYLWRDDVPRAAVQKLLRRSHAMILSSLSEGGANVISEAVVAGVPILASRMDGNVGLLGADYPGYFPVGDTEALAQLLRRIETDRRFVATLHRAIARRAALFRPEREIAAWRRLLAELDNRS
ncbi:MAG TPA: selenoneine biosynthesis selenosugar synthase SenB [Xanthobacteraceae bacterium]|jgi:putative glycosyltransferase (TIGR04348 family)